MVFDTTSFAKLTNLQRFLCTVKVTSRLLIIQDLVSDSSRGSDLSTGSSDSPSFSKISPKRKKTLKTTNSYFYWVTREQGSFDWFKGVMNEVAELDQRVLTAINIYIFKTLS